MKTFFSAFSLLFFSSFLVACDEPKDIKSVEYFLSNTTDLDQKLKECESNPKELGKTPECVNAEVANYKRYAF